MPVTPKPPPKLPKLEDSTEVTINEGLNDSQDFEDVANMIMDQLME